MTPEEQSAVISKALDALTYQLRRVNTALEQLLESLAEREKKITTPCPVCGMPFGHTWNCSLSQKGGNGNL